MRYSDYYTELEIQTLLHFHFEKIRKYILEHNPEINKNIISAHISPVTGLHEGLVFSLFQRPNYQDVKLNEREGTLTLVVKGE
jgi:hypothetical protein